MGNKPTAFTPKFSDETLKALAEEETQQKPEKPNTGKVKSSTQDSSEKTPKDTAFTVTLNSPETDTTMFTKLAPIMYLFSNVASTDNISLVGTEWWIFPQKNHQSNIKFKAKKNSNTLIVTHEGDEMLLKEIIGFLKSVKYSSVPLDVDAVLIDKLLENLQTQDLSKKTTDAEYLREFLQNVPSFFLVSARFQSQDTKLPFFILSNPFLNAVETCYPFLKNLYSQLDQQRTLPSKIAALQLQIADFVTKNDAMGPIAEALIENIATQYNPDSPEQQMLSTIIADEKTLHKKFLTPSVFKDNKVAFHNQPSQSQKSQGKEEERSKYTP